MQTHFTQNAKSWLVLAYISGQLNSRELTHQFEIFKSLEIVSRIGIVASAKLDKTDLSNLAKNCTIDFVLHGEIDSPFIRYRVKRRLRSNEKRVFFWKGEHALSAGTINNYLNYHAMIAKGISVFSPGVHHTFHTKPVAFAQDLDFLQSESVIDIFRSELFRYGVRLVRRFPAFVRSVLGRVATRFFYHKGMSDVMDTQTNVGIIGKRSPEVFLGTLEDKLELLGKRTIEFYPFPQIVNLVTSNVCNLKCIMCPYHSPRYKDKSGFFGRPVYMNDEIFEAIAKEAGQYKAAIKFGQLEEALVHPRIVPWISQARDYGVSNIHITTNGTLLTPELSKGLINGGLTQLYVSMDGATSPTYRRIRGWNSKDDLFAKILRNVDTFLELRSRFGAPIKVYSSMILQGDAIAEKDRFVELWKNRGLDGVIIYQLIERSDTHHNFDKKYFDNYPNQVPRHACSSVFQECYVYPEGQVSLCCTTLLLVPEIGVASMGNIKEKPLSQIWVNQGYTMLRQQLLRNEIEEDSVCLHCAIWDACETKLEHHNDYDLEMTSTTAIYHFKQVTL